MGTHRTNTQVVAPRKASVIGRANEPPRAPRAVSAVVNCVATGVIAACGSASTDDTCCANTVKFHAEPRVQIIAGQPLGYYRDCVTRGEDRPELTAPLVRYFQKNILRPGEVFRSVLRVTADGLRPVPKRLGTQEVDLAVDSRSAMGTVAVRREHSFAIYCTDVSRTGDSWTVTVSFWSEAEPD